jgi:hypothetical protein
VGRQGSRAAGQQGSRAAGQQGSRAAGQQHSRAASVSEFKQLSGQHSSTGAAGVQRTPNKGLKLRTAEQLLPIPTVPHAQAGLCTDCLNTRQTLPSRIDACCIQNLCMRRQSRTVHSALPARTKIGMNDTCRDSTKRQASATAGVSAAFSHPM